MNNLHYFRILYSYIFISFCIALCLSAPNTLSAVYFDEDLSIEDMHTLSSVYSTIEDTIKKCTKKNNAASVKCLCAEKAGMETKKLAIHNILDKYPKWNNKILAHYEYHDSGEVSVLQVSLNELHELLEVYESSVASCPKASIKRVHFECAKLADKFSKCQSFSCTDNRATFGEVYFEIVGKIDDKCVYREKYLNSISKYCEFAQKDLSDLAAYFKQYYNNKSSGQLNLLFVEANRHKLFDGTFVNVPEALNNKGKCRVQTLRQ